VSPVVVQVDNNVAATRDSARVSASSGRPSGARRQGQRLRRRAEAEALFRRALVIREACYGPNDASVAIPLNNLGELLRISNRLAEAESLLRRALAIGEAK